ncbi:MAG: hypothetical protein QF567_02285 [Candidatus Pacearchaeota archaeon]|jgi:hypothetical protein|nr:hypothetical protein [Candidatus Pacearchaeota archaeon]MDP7521039.1 hypothetical protein [Candidatus Pacearchaeota archaeon]|tara:strand:- start:185 stop:460 length:276 start_codon:yes stop_codon:yes gene_type:complete
MAKKRVKKSRKVRKSVRKSKKSSPKKNKVGLVLKNLVLSIVLFVLSLFLYNVSSNELLSNLFWILALITGFVSLAFLIAWLALIVLRYSNK